MPDAATAVRSLGSPLPCPPPGLLPLLPLGGTQIEDVVSVDAPVVEIDDDHEVGLIARQRQEDDRTNCSRFVAIQLRVTRTAAAYLLFQEMRWRLRKTKLGSAQVSRLRIVLIKAAARVKQSVRRIVIHLPDTYAFKAEWLVAARALGAVLPSAAP